MSDSPGHPPAHPPLADASVRTGRPNDTPAIGAVQAETFAAAYALILPSQALDQFHPDAFARAWREALTTPPSTAHRVLVACAGDQVVGFAAIGPSADTDGAAPGSAGEVSVLCVHPAARRAGHGSRLLNASADTLTAAGFQAMSGWVLADDDSTRAFATAAGLSPDGAWRDRIVGPDGETVREVRLVAHLGS
ncbi:MAG: GNAT family N-acetyltransferase [Ornithinimicrobium sp.]